MPHPRRRPVTARELQGFKYFRLLGPLLERLQAVGTESDRAGNRQLFYDQYVALLLLYFFNPVLTSLRGLQLATLTALSGGYVLANVLGTTLTENGVWRAMYFVGLVVGTALFVSSARALLKDQRSTQKV